jgi:hypothetical protein
MTNLLLLAAISTSIALIVWLWHGDSKRRRVARLPAVGASANARRFMVIAALLPGIILAILGDIAAFLIWLGSCTIGGWLVAQLRDWRGSE